MLQRGGNQSRDAATKGESVDQQGIAADVLDRMDLTRERKGMFFVQTNTGKKNSF